MTVESSELERLCAQGYTNMQDVMSNYDRQIKSGSETKLKEGKVYGIYPAWDFNGIVWYADEQFHCEVWVYNSPRTVISAATLEELMELCSDKFGYE